MSPWLPVALISALFATPQRRGPERVESRVLQRIPDETIYIPLSEWVQQGEVTGIPWRVELSPVRLRADQRFELAFQVSVPGKKLTEKSAEHDLWFIARITDTEGNWLVNSVTLRQSITRKLSRRDEVRFGLSALAQPGEYVLWLGLLDNTTQSHSLARRPFKVEPLKEDPLESAFAQIPRVEFPLLRQSEDGDWIEVPAALDLSVKRKQPLDMDVVVNVSPPEQWLRRRRLIMGHNDFMRGALAVLSQLGTDYGQVNFTALDLISREVVFAQDGYNDFDWGKLMSVMKRLNVPTVTRKALEGRRTNGAFFRDELVRRLESEDEGGDGASPPKVVVVLSTSLLFERGSDLKPLVVPQDCRCRVYHLRFRLSMDDVFDDLEKFIKPLKPKTFNIYNPLDFRKAVGQILGDLREPLPASEGGSGRNR